MLRAGLGPVLQEPHEAPNLPGLRSGLRVGAPRLHTGDGGPREVLKHRAGAISN